MKTFLLIYFSLALVAHTKQSEVSCLLAINAKESPQLKKIISSIREEFILSQNGTYKKYYPEPKFWRLNIDNREYRIIEHLGSGGQGSVYRVEFENRTYTLKVFSTDVSAGRAIEKLQKLGKQSLRIPHNIRQVGNFVLMEDTLAVPLDVLLNSPTLPAADKAKLTERWKTETKSFDPKQIVYDMLSSELIVVDAD